MKRVYPSTGTYFYQNPSLWIGQTSFFLLETVYFFISIVFLLVETMWKQFFRMWKRILSTNSLFRWRKRIFCLVETLLNKRLNEIFFKKIRFHYAEKLLSVAVYQKTKKKCRKWFPIARERLLYKKWHHFNMNNGFYYQKFCS